ncbi:MFS transporter [Pusillimonas sp. CC-YST705]|uniref:MFS transporter n=1 Tax=Mesopusillimonas faecipullorum TaxID=2755040 RepID=A0ABS8CAE9_9BURK|nr:MFS transporter [Mesopusillimonas faecipullorum]MCB5363010.1 MFS transporter [Mesopusillimonas faecipullorum]
MGTVNQTKLPTASDERVGVLDFYGDMTPKTRKAFWACSAGFALDAMDFMMFPLLIGTLIALWGMDGATAGGIATISLWSSAVGGWLGGFLSDRVGRVRTMQITVLLFSVGSLLSGFAQSPEQLAIYRALLGIGFGGEAAVAAVTLSEAVSAKYRGRVMGFYASSYAVGWAIAVLAQLLTFYLFEPEIAWRVMFFIGALPAILIFYIRRHVEEPAIAARAKREQGRPSLMGIFTNGNLRSTILGSLLSIGAQGGFYSLMIWMPQFLRAERNISVIGSTPYLLVVIFGAFLGYVTGGWLSDRMGRRFVFIGSSILAASLAYVYTHIPQLSDNIMLLIGFPLGFVASSYYSAVLPCLNELFPTSVRGSGVGFTYNAGRAVGGLFPFLVGAFTATMPLSSAICLFALISYGLLLVTALFIGETNGTELRA